MNFIDLHIHLFVSGLGAHNILWLKFEVRMLIEAFDVIRRAPRALHPAGTRCRALGRGLPPTRLFCLVGFSVLRTEKQGAVFFCLHLRKSCNPSDTAARYPS